MIESRNNIIQHFYFSAKSGLEPLNRRHINTMDHYPNSLQHNIRTKLNTTNTAGDHSNEKIKRKTKMEKERTPHGPPRSESSAEAHTRHIHGTLDTATASQQKALCSIHSRLNDPTSPNDATTDSSEETCKINRYNRATSNI